MTYRSDAAPRLEVEVNMDKTSKVPAGRSSPALPSKVYDCSSSVVLVNDLLSAGIIELEGGDGKLAYCFFRARDLVTRKEGGSLGERLPVGSRVKCHCWLLDEVAKVPYLASVVWTEGVEVPREVVDRILGLPDREDMEAYHRDSRDLAWQLSTNRRSKEEKNVRADNSRERHRSPKKKDDRRRRSRDKEGRRERSRDRSKASSSSRLKKEKRSRSRETSRSSRSSRSDRLEKERSRSRITMRYPAQVWWRHPALGFCQFRELLPTSQLSKYLHPGKQASRAPLLSLSSLTVVDPGVLLGKGGPTNQGGQSSGNCCVA